MALVSDAFPENERARALGMYSSFVGIGFVLGPVIGSLILSIATWRWIFFINLPAILVSFLICLPILHESKHPESPAVDWLGALFLIVCISSLVFSISEGSVYGWSSALIITTFIIAIISLIAFIIVERRVASPLMPLPLFMNSGFLLGMILYMITAISWSIIFLMPLYLHDSVNLSSALVGIVTFAMTIMTMIGPSVAGHYYGEKGPTLVTYAAFFLTIISLVLFTQLRPHWPMWLIVLSFFLFGSAWGSSNGIAIPLGLSRLPNVDNSGLVSGAMLTLMNIVGIITLSFNIVLFDYGRKTSFVEGLHLVCMVLLGLAIVLEIVLAIAAIITLHLVYNRSKASSTS
ncbi:MAG: MFS transporter [Gammaproteobacteria bacterium]|nr:MFS transporter [Gammaproteobacteria bacterium]